VSHYSLKSLTRLRTSHEELQRLFSEVDVHWPHTILEGARTQEQQQRNVESGVSKTMDSRHLDVPARAVDAAPDPLAWPDVKERLALLQVQLPESVRAPLMQAIRAYAKDVGRWYYFAGYVLGTADQMRKHGEMTLRVRHGGDWDGDRDIHEQNFDDLPHFELPRSE